MSYKIMEFRTLIKSGELNQIKMFRNNKMQKKALFLKKIQHKNFELITVQQNYTHI